MTGTILVFVVATAVVAVVGPRLARVAEAIANRLQLGQVIVGAVLLGVVTSLPGLVLTVTAAARGDSELAVANALGGVAAQTLFLAVADIVYRPGTLARGVPTRQVTYQAAMLMVLLALVVIGLGSPSASLSGIHPVTVVLVVAYGGGLALSRRLSTRGTSIAGPADGPDGQHGREGDVGQDGREGDVGQEGDRRRADVTGGPGEVEGGRSGQRGKLGGLEDMPAVEEEEQRPWSSLWSRFAVYATLLSGAGFALSTAGTEIAAETALSATAVGVVLTAVATSTPELVTAVAAARRGAIGLAAGDIIGGNTFDTLFVATADVVHEGSIYAQAGSRAVGLAGLAVLLNGILLAGLVRQGSGTRNVDAESLAIVVVWVVSVVVLVV